jgi:hypothetical protein
MEAYSDVITWVRAACTARDGGGFAEHGSQRTAPDRAVAPRT